MISKRNYRYSMQNDPPVYVEPVLFICIACHKYFFRMGNQTVNPYLLLDEGAQMRSDLLQNANSLNTAREFGEKVRYLRMTKAMLQEDLAHAVGTTKQNISQIEAGRNMPGTRLMLALADFFEVSLDDLFGRKISPK